MAATVSLFIIVVIAGFQLCFRQERQGVLRAVDECDFEIETLDVLQPQSALEERRLERVRAAEHEAHQVVADTRDLLRLKRRIHQDVGQKSEPEVRVFFQHAQRGGRRVLSALGGELTTGLTTIRRGLAAMLGGG